MSTILAIHLASTAAMFGVIFFVQIVHYPLMAEVGREHAAAYAKGHADWTGLVVGPLMLLEMATALWLVALPPTPDLATTARIGLALLVGIWLVTVLASVPCHRRLVRGFDEATHRWVNSASGETSRVSSNAAVACAPVRRHLGRDRGALAWAG